MEPSGFGRTEPSARPAATSAAGLWYKTARAGGGEPAMRQARTGVPAEALSRIRGAMAPAG